MGEYVWTMYTIGGKLPVSKLPELRDLLSAFEDKENLEGASGGSLAAQGQINYGNYDELDGFCQENGLTFHASWAAQPGCFEAGGRYWKPGMSAVQKGFPDDGGEPAITLGQLEIAAKDGKTLESLIAELCLQSSDQVPPFEVCEDEQQQASIDAMPQI
jgi:hypothetical protein